MKVQVTQECIDKGVKVEPQLCPIALALKGAGFSNVSVGAYTISFDQGLLAKDLKQNDQMIFFRRNFDNGKHVSPFEFETDELTKEY